MMITPRFFAGANTAERVPMTTRALPVFIFLKLSYRSPADSAECRTATSSPNRAANCRRSCGVSPISGTSTMALFPCSSACAISCRYTCVLPLPVTPNSSAARGAFSSMSAAMPSYACCCAAESTGAAARGTSEKSGARSTSSYSARRMPFFVMSRSAASLTPVM